MSGYRGTHSGLPLSSAPIASWSINEICAHCCGLPKMRFADCGYVQLSYPVLNFWCKDNQCNIESSDGYKAARIPIYQFCRKLLWNWFVWKVSLADVERHSRVYLTYYLVHSKSSPYLFNIIQHRALCVFTIDNKYMDRT